MLVVPKHVSWPDTVAQIKQQMLAYEPDDSGIYSVGHQQIDVPLPLKELITPTISESDIRCYSATAESGGPNWPPCHGDYLVMQHPLMLGGFTTALRKDQVLEEFYDGKFLLPEDRFIQAHYEDASYQYNLKRFENFVPRLHDHYTGTTIFRDFHIGFRGIFVIYGLYFPFRQGWVDNAAPRQCFFIDQYVYDNPRRSGRKWGYPHALLRFDFMPEITDLLRHHEDELVFPSQHNLREIIGFNKTYSSYYIIVESPEIESNLEW